MRYSPTEVHVDPRQDERKKLANIRNVNGFKEALKSHFLYSYTVEPDFIYY